MAEERGAAKAAPVCQCGLSGLFPGRTAVPADKPRLPPAAGCSAGDPRPRRVVVAAFDASKGVALVRGKLSKAQVVAYLLADALGTESDPLHCEVSCGLNPAP
jgi:hypothetical protein